MLFQFLGIFVFNTYTEHVRIACNHIWLYKYPESEKTGLDEVRENAGKYIWDGWEAHTFLDC